MAKDEAERFWREWRKEVDSVHSLSVADSAADSRRQALAYMRQIDKRLERIEQFFEALLDLDRKRADADAERDDAPISGMN